MTICCRSAPRAGAAERAPRLGRALARAGRAGRSPSGKRRATAYAVAVVGRQPALGLHHHRLPRLLHDRADTRQALQSSASGASRV